MYRPSSYRALLNALKAVFSYNKSLIIKFENFWVDLPKKVWKKIVLSLGFISISECHSWNATLSFSIDVCTYNSKSTCPLKNAVLYSKADNFCVRLPYVMFQWLSYFLRYLGFPTKRIKNYDQKHSYFWSMFKKSALIS